MHRLCSAHSKRTGEPCRTWAMDGKNVCRHHGGRAGPKRGNGYNPVQARKASVASAARRRADKAAGLPVSVMGGVRRRGQRNPIKAKALIEAQVAAIPVIDKPFEEMTDAERLNANLRLSLLHDHFILTLPSDPETLTVMGYDPAKIINQKTVLSQHTKNVSVKINEAGLRHQEASDKIELWREELKNIKVPSKSG